MESQSLNSKKCCATQEKNLRRNGYKFHLNKEVGKDISFKKLHEGYDAIFLGMGTYTSLEGGFRGESLPQVHKAIDYLIGNTNHLLKVRQKPVDYINLKGKNIVVLVGVIQQWIVTEKLQLGKEQIQCHVYTEEMRKICQAQEERL